MADIPDVYAEIVSVTTGVFGCILTFSRLLPTGDPTPHQDPTEIVARVRLSPPVAKAMVEALRTTLAAADQQGPQGTKTVSN